MKTLEYTSILGILCMVAEMLNLRKLVWPLCVVGLFAIFGLNLTGWNMNAPFYNNMFVIDNFSVAFSVLLILLAFCLRK